jgi:hypothetical protein
MIIREYCSKKEGNNLVEYFYKDIEYETKVVDYKGYVIGAYKMVDINSNDKSFIGKVYKNNKLIINQNQTLNCDKLNDLNQTINECKKYIDYKNKLNHETYNCTNN